MNLAGSLLRRRCYYILANMFTFELAIRKEHKLVTAGPYAFVRHPSYSGALLSGLGAVISHTTDGSWLAGLFPSGLWFQASIWAFGTFIVYSALVSRMNKEDALLKAAFGKEWEDWASNVQYKIIPGVY